MLGPSLMLSEGLQPLLVSLAFEILLRHLLVVQISIPLPLKIVSTLRLNLYVYFVLSGYAGQLSAHYD